MSKAEAGGLRLKTKVLLGLGLCVLIAAALLGGFLLGASREQGSGPVITSDLLGERLRSVQQLVTVEYHYTNMGRFEDQKDFYGWKVPFTTKSFIISYDGVIRAGIDMSALDIQVDETARRITVTLPESRILSHEILEDSLEVFDESSNIFNPISIQDYNGFTADQKDVMEQKSLERGLLQEADDKASMAVESLLSMLPETEAYTITVETGG